MKEFKGTGVSPGIAIAQARRVTTLPQFSGSRLPGGAGREAELKRLGKAYSRTIAEIEELRRDLARKVGRNISDILKVQALLLGDQNLWRKIEKEIENGREAAEAIEAATAELVDSFSRIEDTYLRERRHDIEDLRRRLIGNLVDGEPENGEAGERVVIVASDLTPSETASLEKKSVAGFVTDMGGPTSHTAIVARALEIPAVVGLREVTAAVNTGDLLVVDGRQGVVIVSPDEETLRKYRLLQEGQAEAERRLMKLRDRPATTRDGFRLVLGANIETEEEIPSVLAHGADEIGLFRTEFLYLNRGDLPSEEEQYTAYARVISAMSPRPVVIRTLDLGGDKFASGLDMPEEGNPFLGLRGIRFCLARPDIFRVQLRAILRAARHGETRIMYPLVSDLEEVRAANRLLEEARRELASEGVEVPGRIPVGIMIEVPATACRPRAFAAEADFFSIGSNDLIQYALAVERGNENTSYLYDPLNPGVLGLVEGVIKAAHEAGIKVCVCGEMAADPETAFLLAGMGIDELSMASLAIPEVKQSVISFSLEEARDFARRALELDSAAEIRALLRDEMARILPGGAGGESPGASG